MTSQAQMPRSTGGAGLVPNARASQGAPSKTSMRITELAKLLGTTTRALRYYEEKGLISVQRKPGGSRFYSAVDIDRLKIVIALRRANLPVSDIYSAIDSDPVTQQKLLFARLNQIENERILIKKTIDILGLTRRCCQSNATGAPL